MISKFFRRQLLAIRHKSNKRRALRIELLEDRRVLATAVWTNVLQPLNVSGHPSGIVSPLDVLYIINEINARKYSHPQTGLLPTTPPPGLEHSFPDVDCDQHVTPLDALVVINHLNGGPAGRTWSFQGSGDSSPGTGNIEVFACRPVLVEGDAYRVGVTSRKVLPSENSAIEVSFYAPQFDTATQNTVRDALEIAVLDSSGQSLVLPIAPNQLAAFNWSEGLDPITAPAAQANIAPADELSKVTINLVGVPANTPVEVLIRLVNNDQDNQTRVRLHDIQVVPANGPNPQETIRSSNSRIASVRPAASQPLEEITGSIVPSFGATRLSDDGQLLITDLRITNANDFAVSGEVIVVVDALTDERIQFLNPDGYLADGRPFVRVDSLSGGQWLAPGESTNTRDVRFRNPLDRRFSFRLTALGRIHHSLGAFISTPTTEIEAGRTYRYHAQVTSSIDSPLTYSLMVGPEQMTIEPNSGQLRWLTQTPDVGSHQITIRATDQFGLFVEQRFDLRVVEQLANRPPIFTSEPDIDILVSSPFEVHTYSTGNGPVAATLISSSSGFEHVVTANMDDNQLGMFRGDTSSLGNTSPIGLGERPASEQRGVFQGPQAIDLGIAPNTSGRFERDVQQVLAEDINSDGNPDAITLLNLRGNGNWNDPNDRGFLVVRLGMGDGSFRDGWQVELPSVAGRIGRGATVHFADVTSDGLKDLVVTTIATNRILVYANIGSGTFDPNPITSTVAGNYVLNSQIDDLDGDGNLDLVLFENVQVLIGGRQAISVYRGDGTGRFVESQVITEDSNNGGYGYLADVDGLNGPDIVRLNYNNLRLETYLNDGTGNLGTRIDTVTKAFHSTSNPSGNNFNVNSGYFDDFDSDGIIDALLSGPFGVTLMRGQGDGRFGDGTPTGSVTLLPYQVEWFGIVNHSGRGMDLNGDEHLDFVFGNLNGENSLTVGLGRGDGSFELSQYNTAFEPDIGSGIVRNSQNAYFAAIADFNRDGVKDVLLGNALNVEQAGSVGLLHGDHPGSFRAPQSLRNFNFNNSFGSSFSPTTFGMRETVTGDFNSDGILDLVTLGGIGFGYGFYFSPGLGDGTFGPYTIGMGGITNANSLTVLDIDLDGNLDLAWIDGAQLRQAFGLGNGAFQLLPSVTAPGGQAGVSNNTLQVDDFNGDGYPDLVYRLQTGNINTNFVTRLVVLLYDPVNRRYNILPDVHDTITNWPRAHGFYLDESVGIGDLNGDGKKEIFFFSRSIPSSNIPARWVILEPTGGPATDASTLFRKTVIENPPFIPHDRSIHSFVVDDFDGDGMNDIAYSSHNAHTTVMFGNGDFTFRDPTNYYTQGLHLYSGDFNGDGITDLVPMWGWGFISYSLRPFQSILFGRGDGTFSEMNGFTAVSNMNLAAIGDFNGDGRDDLAGSASGSKGVAFLSRPKGVSDVASGDLNGDGQADLVSIISGLNRVKIHYQVTDEVFARQQDLFTDLYPVAVDLLDVDEDGLLDILTANQQGKSVSIFRQSAGGNFNREDIALPVRPSDLRIADLNSDGIQDLIVLSKMDESIVVLTGSAGTFSVSLVLPLGFKPGDFVLGDVTQDSTLDVVLTDPSGDRVIVLPGHGNGTFGAAISVLGVSNPGAIAIADMNRDGRNDLVVTQPDAGRVGFLYQRAAGKFTTPQWIDVGSQPIKLVADDVNSDGATDVLVVNQGDDTVSLILNRFDPSRLWTYQPTAIDPDDDPVSFELVDAPGGMLHDPVTNTIYWAPMPEQLGGHGVVVEASDGRGGVTQQGFRVTVTAPVSQDVPRFTSTPVTQVAADAVYQYRPNVAEQNQSTLRYSLVQAPEGMTIHPTTGEIDWDPRTSSLKLNTGSRNYGFIEAPDTPSLRPSSVTIEGWYYFEDPVGAVWENLLAKTASASNRLIASYGLEYFYGTLRAKIGTPDSTNSLAVVTAPMPVEFRKWTHVAMTFDDASKTLTLWINGRSVGTAISPEGISYNNSPLHSGRNVASLTRQRIWNRALTGAEIAEGMFADVPHDASGLVLQWNFNESRDVITVVDASPAKNHGTLKEHPDWYNFPSREKALALNATHEVIVRVENGRGGVAEQSFSVDIVPPFLKQISGIAFLDADGNGVRDLPLDFNRIANSDFSSGFAGWETDFFQRPPQSGSSWLGDSQVTVGLSSRVIPSTSDYFGHTNGSNQDFMLIINGDNQDRVAWRQMVSLNAGQNYDFSFWTLRPNNHEAAKIEVRWNGQALVSVFTLEDVSAGNWKQFRHSFTAPSAHGVLEIVSLGSTLPPNPNASSSENSFAIDDLLLVPSTAQRVIVPGFANPYLAGMPNGSTAYGSTAPQGSPPSLAVQPGQILRIRATGHTRSDGFVATRSPDGIVHNAIGTVSNALNGISQYAGPNHGSLLGVFLTDESPAWQTPPEALDFRSNGNVPDGINYTSIAPELRQLFFIGDGLTSVGIEQTIVVPQGATRLFLANSSTNSWNSNVGSFEVQVLTSSGEPVQAGRTVFLDSNRNGIYDPGEPTAVTDAQGRYLLTTTGNQAHVGLVGVAGYLQSTPLSGVQHFDLNSVTPTVNFGSRAVPEEDATPVFISEPITQAMAPGSYTYQAFAQSPLAASVRYELIAAPEGMTVDRTSGLVQWQPLASQAGVHDVLIKVSDQERRFAIQRFDLSVSINTPPIITSTPPVDSQVGVAWRYQVRAQDAEHEEFTYRLITFPTGMTIANDSGIIDFVPGLVGSFHFELQVDDGFGGVTRQEATVNVTAAGSNNLPQWVVGLKPTAIVQRQYATQFVAMDDDHEPLTFSLVSGPVGMTVSASGQVQWQPMETGNVSVTIAVEDSRGGRVERTDSIAVVSRAPLPTLSILSLPETAARVGILYAYDVIAPEAVLFELVQAPVGMSIDPQYGLIRWIPTRDSLGVQEVLVRCIDLFGNEATQNFRIAVRSSSMVPTISSVPPTEAFVGRTYLYSVRTSNPSSSPLHHELVLAPVGMTIDAQSGEIAWTPTAAQVGLAAVSIRVSDGLGHFSTQTFSIAVAAGVSNLAPTIQSTAPGNAVVGQAYVYTLQGTDPEGDSLTYSVRSAPAGFDIDAVSGVITWTPQTSDIGTVTIVLTASDPLGAVAVQSLQVDVRAANRAPEIRSNPTLSVSQGAMYRYDVLAIDPDREPLTYELVQGPVGMTIDALGRIRWQTQLDESLGGREVVVRVRDGLGAVATQSYTFGVVPDTQAPRLTIIVTGEPVLFPWTVHPAIVRVIATDNVGVTNVELKVDGQAIELAPDGTARVYFSAPGNGRLIATATDAAGNVGTATGRVSMRSGEEDGSGNPAPEAAITSIGDGTAVSGFVDIIGTAISPDFERYTLSYRRIDQTQYRVIHAGTTQVSAASLGKWDTTLFENDHYVLKLEVLDTFGSFASIEVEVSVTGNLKLGNFRLSFEDLTIPVAGIPISIVRTYDTLRADRDGDFGYGWRMEYRNTDLRVSLPKSGLEDLGIYTPFRSGTKIFMTLPGGQRVGWTFTPEIKVLPGFSRNENLIVASPRYTPDRGNTATLSAGSGWLTVNQFGELYATGGMPWNPASPDFGGGFTVTLADGTRYFIDGTTGLMQTSVDRNGNTLTFSDSGITSSLGDVGITIARDRHGRITSITDPAGHAIRYGYSSSGDLVSVTDRVYLTTRMQYRLDIPHFLQAITNPLGELESVVEYDQEGRIKRTNSVAGGLIEHDIEPDQHRHRVVDSRGGITLVSYDELGNPLTVLDARGDLTKYSYDSNGWLAESVDALGRKTQYSSDALGNVTKIVDPAGNTTLLTYDLVGRLKSKVSPSGLRTEYFYDSRGDLTSIIDATGVRSTMEYQTAGKVKSVKHGSLPVITNQFDSIGNRIGWTDFYGHNWTASFDRLGKILSSESEIETDSGLLKIVQLNTYDSAGRITRSEKPDGSVGVITYDDLGYVASRTYGNVTSWLQYDSAGRLSRVTHEDDSFTSREYDSTGNLVAYRDEDGYVTRWEFDLVGNLVAEIYPDDTPNDPNDNPRELYTYDLVNRLTSITDSLGHITHFYYDARDLLVAIRAPEDNVTQFEYDVEGRKIAETDALGRKTQYGYDDAGNVVRIEFADGTVRTQQFDLFGRILMITDENGKYTTYARNDLGQILSITDGLGVTTRYEYDWQGNVSKIIDGLGRETVIGYDVMGRETSRISPSGHTWTTEYDERGNMSKRINPDGDILTFQYNHRNAVITKTSPEGTTQFSYSPAGRLVRSERDSHIIEYEYNSRGNVGAVRQDDLGWTYYQYDSNGRVVEISSPHSNVRLDYDSLGRISATTDHNGYVSRYYYDAVGNTIRIERGDAVEEFYGYDQRNRLVSKEVLRGDETILELHYSLDSTGRVVAKNEGGKRIEFQYDSRYQLLQEIEYSQGVAIRATAYNYDLVGNRLSRIDSLDGISEYQYDLDDRLLSVTDASGISSYQYNRSGSLIRRVSDTTTEAFEWNSDQQLMSFRQSTVEGTRSEVYKYDAQGNLIETSTGPKTIRWFRDYVFSRGSIMAELTEGESSIVHIHGKGRELVYRGDVGVIPITDRLGTVRVHVGLQGEVLHRFTYDSFGVLREESGGSEDLIGFAGSQRGTINQLVRMGVRLYDPGLGRFISSDPHPGFFDFPQSLHKYTYVHNDPVNAIDPTGLFANFNLAGVMTSVTVASSLLVGLGTTLKSAGSGKAMDVSIGEGLKAAVFAGIIGKMVGTGRLAVALLGVGGAMVANDMGALVDAFYDPEGPTGEPLTDARKAIALGQANAVAYVTGQIIETAVFMTAAQRVMARGYQKIEPRLQAAINDANSRLQSLMKSLGLLPQLQLSLAQSGGINFNPNPVSVPKPNTEAGGAGRGRGGNKTPHRIVEEIGESVNKGMDPKSRDTQESITKSKDMVDEIRNIQDKVSNELLPALFENFGKLP
ncbi:FG-GAP-like repeat-containing protein [Pirellulaceae bacterium SH449]